MIEPTRLYAGRTRGDLQTHLELWAPRWPLGARCGIDEIDAVWPYVVTSDPPWFEKLSAEDRARRNASDCRKADLLRLMIALLAEPQGDDTSLRERIRCATSARESLRSAATNLRTAGCPQLAALAESLAANCTPSDLFEPGLDEAIPLTLVQGADLEGNAIMPFVLCQFRRIAASSAMAAKRGKISRTSAVIKSLAQFIQADAPQREHLLVGLARLCGADCDANFVRSTLASTGDAATTATPGANLQAVWSGK